MTDPFFIPPPHLILDKPGITASTVVRQVSSDIIQIEHTPNRFALIGLILTTILTGVFIYMRLDLGYFSGLAWVFFGYEHFTRRKISCEINKQSNRIVYDIDGWAGTSWNRQHMTCNFAKVGHFEMQRHIRRGGDSFQVVLWLRGFKKYPLSHTDLRFSECQRMAELIRDFIDPKIPISAED